MDKNVDGIVSLHMAQIHHCDEFTAVTFEKFPINKNPERKSKISVVQADINVQER